jgi:membrane protease YdiL (CAAX protease family)
MLLGEASGFLAVLLATLLMAKIERRPFRVFGLGGINPLRQFLQGLAWGVSCLTVLILALKLTGLLHFDARLLSNAEAIRFGLIWLGGFLLVALLEETLTRGYLQYTLARGFAGIYGAAFKTRHRHALGFWTAAFLLSFLFGLGHGSNPGESPIGLLSAGLAGFVFCLALYRTGSLWWAIGFHTSWDWAQSFLYGVADSGQMVQGHLFATHPIGKPLLSGGLTGPEGSIFVIPTLALVAAIITLTLPHTHHPGAGLAHPDVA